MQYDYHMFDDLSFILNDIQVGKSNDMNKLLLVFENTIKIVKNLNFIPNDGYEYTVDLYKYPNLLKEWIEIFPLDHITTLNLLQRIIEYNISESYQIIKDQILNNVSLQQLYYLRLRPFLINDNNKEIRYQAKTEINAYDPLLDGEIINVIKPIDEEYINYRKTWYIMTYGNLDDKTYIINK